MNILCEFCDNARSFEQTVAKCSWIFAQIRISNELYKITLKCKADQTAEFGSSVLAIVI